MTKVYVLIYDYDHGSRENCNIFYSPIEVFADDATREQRIDLLCKTNPDIGYRTEDLDPFTVHDFDIPDQYLPDPDDVEDDDDRGDDDAAEEEDDVTSATPSFNPTMGNDDAEEAPYQYVSDPWMSVDPTEYLFHATLKMDPQGSGRRVTVVYITPVRYFDATNDLCNHATRITMPDGFSKAYESCYVFTGSPSAARGELRDMGMYERDTFSEVCKEKL